MKFYKLNDTWVSWNELHNGYGYTTGPSVAVTYKSAHNGSSWGEDAGSGYYVGDIDDMVHGSFWCDSDYGWFELDGLVWNPEIYPSNATPLMMQNGGITSPAVSLESDGVTYYLIKVIVADTCWITADEASELGWEVYDEPQGTFIVFDTVENKVVSAFTNELTYGEIEGIVLQSPRLVYGIDINVPTIQFWFTEEGRNYDEDKELLSRSILRDENGNRIKSPDNTIYDDVPILAYMHINGDMLESTDGTIEYYGSGSLRTLTSVNGSAVGESVWSVFAERVFTLSFVNTQLPDITITLPADETGHKGTSITLPTMSGEYESGGKTWKPSAWDIGAFGSSYTLNADTVAHLIFEEVQQYQEITLYMTSGAKAVQTDITSAFTGNVNSAYCYQLYTDEQCTIPWTGYDYSNDYEIWYYYNGTWFRQVDAISAMPDYTTTGTPLRTIGLILMDTGYLWTVSNITGSSYSITTSSITVRIYPKDQQYYAFYLSTSSVYNNSSVSNNSTGSLKGKPGISSAQTVPWGVNDATLPTRTIHKLFGSAGNELSQTGIDWRDPSLGFNFYQIANSSGSSISLRAVVFSLSVPTSYSYPNNTNTDASINSSTNYQMFDENGNAVQFDSTSTYRVIGMFKANGDASDNTFSNYNKMEVYSDVNGILCLRYTGSGTITFYKVWYIKTPI